MASPQTIVTMDGPAGSGKTTVARNVAARLGYRFLDTGAMYRAATLAALPSLDAAGDGPIDEAAICDAVDAADVTLDHAGVVRLGGRPVEDEIRTDRVTRRVSEVSALRGVRERMTALQLEFGRTAEPGMVAEGRDMATVVFPDARHRFFLDASVEVRADRRLKELAGRGLPVPGRDEMIARVDRRDRLDSTREHAPLRMAAGVTRVDTGDLDIDQVVAAIVAQVRGGAAAEGGA